MTTPSPDDAATYWDARYAERDRIWSGRANASLVGAVADLVPGRALDLGCGEGGDSVWLATHGWRVTGVDIAERALDRGRAAASQAALPDDAVRWVVADLATWEPDGPYDLVSACFLHSAVDFPRTDVLRRAAGAVTRGGHLLVVGHLEPPPWSRFHGHDHPELLGPDEQVAELALDPDGWETVVSERRPREAAGPDGEVATLRDTVVLLRRR